MCGLIIHTGVLQPKDVTDLYNTLISKREKKGKKRKEERRRKEGRKEERMTTWRKVRKKDGRE
jgi:hypothetical protein